MADGTAVVTGAAGFIGSHLVEHLLAAGWLVRGIDCFTPSYQIDHKHAHLAAAMASRSFELVRDDLTDAPALVDVLGDVDVVFHLAGEAGVRTSWADGFPRYLSRNVLATQRLLEAIASGARSSRLVIASSSSVYGNATRFPTEENDPTLPCSPYGVTKLAAEQLVRAYAQSHGFRAVALRLFTVYGPRQRPDMAFHRVIEAAFRGTPFPLFGRGDQVRDFTYVGDVVRALVSAAKSDAPPGAVFNIAGGTQASLNYAVKAIEGLTGRPVAIRSEPSRAGDAVRTGADIRAAMSQLGWAPQLGLDDGLAHQVAWHRDRLGPGIVAAAGGGDPVPPPPAAQ